jgi:Zn-dependent metalloprotease
MRYGPRFGQAAVSAKYQYSERQDDERRKDHAILSSVMKAMPLHKKELMRHSSGQSKARNMERQYGAEKRARREAEERMVETVRAFVATLEFQMTELMQYHQVSTQEPLINQIAIHNVLVKLRTKCGISFQPNPEYDHHIDAARVHLTQEQIVDERELKMAEQRAAREQRMRAITDRLIARPRRGE